MQVLSHSFSAILHAVVPSCMLQALSCTGPHLAQWWGHLSYSCLPSVHRYISMYINYALIKNKQCCEDYNNKCMLLSDANFQWHQVHLCSHALRSVSSSLISLYLLLILADLLPLHRYFLLYHTLFCLLCMDLIRGLLQPPRGLQKGQELQKIRVNSDNSLVECCNLAHSIWLTWVSIRCTIPPCTFVVAWTPSDYIPFQPLSLRPSSKFVSSTSVAKSCTAQWPTPEHFILGSMTPFSSCTNIC